MEINDLYYWAIFIGVLVILFASAIPRADAYCEVLMPGDPVYLNETCDVSRVVSWDGMFAHFSSEVYSETPDRIANVTGFMYRYYIDPTVFVVGNWYKWDRPYDANGYNLAFVVKSGTRPNVTITNTTNKTINVTPIPEVRIAYTNLLVARGEQIEYSYNTSYQGRAWLWMFDNSNEYLGVPLEYYNGYNYIFSKELTQSLPAGTYTEYIQFAGNNSRQDVFYKDKALQTIYRDIPTVYLTGNYTSVQIPGLFTKMVNNELSDDKIVPLKIIVEDPTIVIKQYYRDGDTIVIQGNTSLSVGTKINCIIDPEHWTTQTEKNQNTYTVSMKGTIDREREFVVRLPLNWDELSLGEHNIVLSAQTGLINLSIHKEFRVTDTFIMPTPTPEKKKVALDENGKPLVTAVPSPTPTPTPLPTTIPTTVPTPQPTVVANTTTVRPTPTPIPTTTMYTVPLNPFVGIVAIGLVYFIRRIYD